MKARQGFIITSNGFASGEVLYLGHQGWQPWVYDARLFSNEQAAAQVIADVARPDIVVDAYAIAVEVTDKVMTPLKFREKIRAIGPTNYHHGKQENHVQI